MEIYAATIGRRRRVLIRMLSAYMSLGYCVMPPTRVFRRVRFVRTTPEDRMDQDAGGGNEGGELTHEK